MQNPYPLRGMIAPASLKLGKSAHVLLDHPSPLRGMIAPASLKHVEFVPIEIDPDIATPGHDCPGLIEALPPLARVASC